MAGKTKSAARVAAVVLVGLLVPVRGAEKLKPEDVVAKSVAAFDPAQKRATIRSRLAEGVTRMRIMTTTTGGAVGRALLLSTERKFRVAFPFPTKDYWGEQFVFDGEKAEIGYIQPTMRSQLGVFLNQHPQVLREGLFGGVLTTAWPLLDLAGRQPKLSYDGLKKLEGRELHRLEYRMRKGHGQLTIYLFFEPETFRHVASTYTYTEAAPMGIKIEESSQQQETRLVLQEFFEDFREADGVVLPTRWRVRMNSNVNQQSSFLEWEVRLEKVSHNVPVEPKELRIRPNNQ